MLDAALSNLGKGELVRLLLAEVDTIQLDNILVTGTAFDLYRSAETLNSRYGRRTAYRGEIQHGKGVHHALMDDRG